MSFSSSHSPKSRLGKWFHRRGPSDAASASGASPNATATATATALEARHQNGAVENAHVQRKRSLRDYVPGRSGGKASRSGSAGRRVSLQSSYNAPQNLPSGADIAAANPSLCESPAPRDGQTTHTAHPMLAQQQEERPVEHEHATDGMRQAASEAPVATAATANNISPSHNASSQHAYREHTRTSSLQKPPQSTTTTTTTTTAFQSSRQPITHTTHTSHAAPSVTKARTNGPQNGAQNEVQTRIQNGIQNPPPSASPPTAREPIIQTSPNPIDLSTVVDLRNTEDVDYHTSYAPAVTHETVHVEHHEIRTEVLTRETHNHHIFHRILPILDFEVLPPRHFIETRSGGKYEISPDLVPATHNEHIQTLIHDAVASMLPRTTGPAFPTTFSARSFPASEGDLKQWVGPHGEPCTEQWWVHPPTWQTGGKETGQTEPFHLGSEFPEDDGLRIPLPEDVSQWPQQLKRASLTQQKRLSSMSMSQRERERERERNRDMAMDGQQREWQEYQDYQKFVDGIPPMGNGNSVPPKVPRHDRNPHTVLPIRMQHENGGGRGGAMC